MIEDCTTQDIERLRSRINDLALELQIMQSSYIKDLQPRDQVIVVQASINMLSNSSRRATKNMWGMRFVKSVGKALLLTRKFGSGQLRRGE